MAYHGHDLHCMRNHTNTIDDTRRKQGGSVNFIKYCLRAAAGFMPFLVGMTSLCCQHSAASERDMLVEGVLAAAISEETENAIYCVSEGELIRVDRSSLETERVQGIASRIRDIAIAKECLWISAEGGIYRLDLASDSTVAQSVLRSDSGLMKFFHPRDFGWMDSALLRDASRLWLLGDGGIYAIDTVLSRVEAAMVDARVLIVHCMSHRQGSFWIGLICEDDQVKPAVVAESDSEPDTPKPSDYNRMFFMELPYAPTKQPRRIVSPISLAIALCASSTDLWVADRSNLYRMNTASNESPFEKVLMDASESIMALGYSESRLWILVEEGEKESVRFMDVGTGDWSTVATSKLVDHSYIGMPFLLNYNTRFYHSNPVLWVVGNNSIYSVDLKDTTLVTQKLFPHRIQACTFYQLGDLVWIATDVGLFVFDLCSKERTLELVSYEGQNITSIQQYSERLWVGTSNGLYHIDLSTKPYSMNRLIETQAEVRRVFCGKTTVFAATASGLYCVRGIDRSPWRTELRIEKEDVAWLYPDHRVRFSWDVCDLDYRVTEDGLHGSVEVLDENQRVVHCQDAKLGEFEVPPLGRDGSFRLRITASDLHGVPVTSDYSFRVWRGPNEVYTWLTKLLLGWTAGIYLAMNVLTFVCLVIGARWSSRCLAFLTDPVVRKFGLYFGFALRHVVPLRIWIFQRYFENLNRDVAQVQGFYVDRHLRRSDGSEVSVSELWAEIDRQRQIWIHGSPGVGKTETVRELIRNYCSERSFYAAWKRYRLIPILATVRDFGDISITEIARASLTRNGLSFRNDCFFEDLLASGGFLLILDGLNEGNLDEAVERFAATNEGVSVLITSQIARVRSQISQYELPDFDRRSAQKVFESATRGFKPSITSDDIPDKLWAELRSGYDVKLVADILVGDRQRSSDVFSRRLPNSRLALYKATIDCVPRRTEDDVHPELIAKVAWDLWKRNLRQFEKDSRATDTVLSPWREANVIVSRGQWFEFRHDLMQAFLAACWATTYSASVEVTIERLSDKEVWDLSPQDQRRVFGFVAELIELGENLNNVGRFALQDCDRRSELLGAVSAAAKSRGWTLQLQILSP